MTSTYEFDPNTKTWQKVAGGELPKEIARAISFTLNGKAYLAGGKNDTDLLAETYEFDPNTKTWQKVAGWELPKGISAISFTLNGKAYLAGGLDDIVIT